MAAEVLSAIDSVSKKMGAREFLKFVRKNRAAIQSSQYIAPRLGSRHLGYFHVKFRYVPQSTTALRTTTRG